MKISHIFSIFCLFLFSCGNSNQKLVEQAPLISKIYKDDLGNQIVLPNIPSKVVSLAPSITEIIFGIGAEDKLVGRSQACDFPTSASKIQEITTFPEVDVEQILAQKPDLLFITDEIFSKDQIALLKHKGLNVYAQSYNHFSDVYRNIRIMGKILEKEKEANKLADSLEKVEKTVISLTKDEAKYRTMILISENPLKVIGGTGYLSEMIEKAGGLNVFKDKKDAYPSTTQEEILEMQPECIIIPSNDPHIYEKLLEMYPLLSTTPADINHRVFIESNPDIFYRPSPRAMEGLIEMTNVLHSHLTPSYIMSGGK